MLNLFQHPTCLLVAVLVESWTLKQVQGDGVPGLGRPSSLNVDLS
jgi:hypothetical protein